MNGDFMITICCVVIIIVVFLIVRAVKYSKLKSDVLKKLGYSNWDVISYYDDSVVVKSRRTLENYDDIKYFKENREKLGFAERTLKRKNDVAKTLEDFLRDNEFKERWQYKRLKKLIAILIEAAKEYRILVKYITSAGNNLDNKEIAISKRRINRFKTDPSLLMTKGEYNKYIREKKKEELEAKHHEYYEHVNNIIDRVTSVGDSIVVKGDKEQLENLAEKLYDKTVNSIKKIKTIDSEEWDIIGKLIDEINNSVDDILNKNKKILDYYKSDDFEKIKATCEVLMSTQRDFNVYIEEKVQSISKLFGARVVRNDTVNNDEYNYIRPYKKTLTPFTAEVSSSVFSSAENKPLDYVIKYFYPNKDLYPQHIQNLHLLVEELETLKDAKQIIENYKADYQKYLVDVPDFIMQEDEVGFYSRLGFADISEDALTVDYKFSYTSGGGKAGRSFSIPMTEDTVVELIKLLEDKLTLKSFAKEQRALMTNKLRESIKQRDDFTCCNCGNSVKEEPNLLLEIDHIIPVSKGGCTVEDNLQTLCWRCNRSKGNKIIE